MNTRQNFRHFKIFFWDKKHFLRSFYSIKTIYIIKLINCCGQTVDNHNFFYKFMYDTRQHWLWASSTVFYPFLSSYIIVYPRPFLNFFRNILCISSSVYHTVYLMLFYTFFANLLLIFINNLSILPSHPFSLFRTFLAFYTPLYCLLSRFNTSIVM